MGRRIDALVENGISNKWIVRAAHQAPEIDGCIRIKSKINKSGIHRVKIIDYRDHDLVGELTG